MYTLIKIDEVNNLGAVRIRLRSLLASINKRLKEKNTKKGDGIYNLERIPFTEEMIFRKSLRNCFNNKVLYILLSGLIFGSMHLLSASSIVELVFLIPYSSLGCVFAYMYYKTDNIFVPMTFHMMHNTIIVLNYILVFVIGG